MCGIPVDVVVFLLTVISVVAVVVKFRGIFKRLVDFLPDNDFIIFLVISFTLLFAAVEVGQFIHEHNGVISAGFDSARRACSSE